MINSTPNTPAFSLEDMKLHWQMTRCEKYAFHSLLAHIQPEVAIEIGTYKGGSLQVISKYAGHVHSVDISTQYQPELDGRFDNVDFHYGDSKKLLPPLMQKIAGSGKHLEFVLIDGDHTTEGVRSDINTVLQYQPKKPMYIVFHDSFHPPCREGILLADWQDSPYVHYVEVDYVPGVFHYEGFDTAPPRSMYGGLCVARLEPEPRKGPLKIHQSQKGLFDTVYEQSMHKPQPASVYRKARSLAGRVKRKILS